MYFVNWQRHVSIANRNGQMVVVKSNKTTKSFHEYLLASTYSLVSIVLGHPDSPPVVGEMAINNEGSTMRNYLRKLGIRTPRLISLSDSILVEEYIESGDLYNVFLEFKEKKIICSLATEAGVMTGILHNDGKVFLDNKSQNYLVGQNYESLYRTDLAFIQTKSSVFSRSMDIGTFLASIIDLNKSSYSEIENAFFQGYFSVTRQGFPYLSPVLRNLLALGFAFNHKSMLKNMLVSSAEKCSISIR
jgi:tRNA A-37 threonylcarbamoyl transferase component Bud32